MKATQMTASRFVEMVCQRVDEEIEMQQASPRSDDWRVNVRRWSAKGSAGAARRWLLDIAVENPDASPAEIVEMLSSRVESEIAQRPKWYSRAHLRGVVFLAFETLKSESLPVRNAPPTVREAWADLVSYIRPALEEIVSIVQDLLLLRRNRREIK